MAQSDGGSAPNTTERETDRLYQAIEAPNKHGRLGRQALREALRGQHADVLTEIHEVLVRELATEDARFNQLASKASSIQTVIGLSLTIVGLAGGLFGRSLKVPGLALVLLAVTVATAFVAAVAAHRAQLVDSYKGLNPADVAGRKFMHAASKAKKGERVATWHRIFIPDLWLCWVTARSINGEKARLIKQAQKVYMTFIALLAGTLATTAAFLVVQR